MKILFTMTRAFDPYAAGVQRTTFKLGKYFTEQGIEVAYFSTKNLGNKDVEFGKLFYAPFSEDLKNNENKKYLEEVLVSWKPDIVINQMPYEKELRTILSVNKYKFGYTLLGCLRNSLFSFLKNVRNKSKQNLQGSKFNLIDNKVGLGIIRSWHIYKHRKELRAILDDHDRFILLAPQNLDELKFFVKDYKLNKTLVIPNSIPSVHPEAIQQKTKHILFVGSLNVHQKRADLLLPFWQNLEAKLPDWEFIIVGDGAYSKIMKDKIEKKKLPRVYLKGHQMPEIYYREASLFIMTSAYEGFPNTILEAHSFGCPVFAFRSYAAIDWIVNDNIDACICDPFDIGTLSKRMVELANNPIKLAEMQLNAIDNAKRFTIDVVGQLWLDFFEEIQIKA